MSTKTRLTIFGIVAMSMALITAASFTNLAIAASSDSNDNGKSKHDSNSGSSGSDKSSGGSSGSSGSSGSDKSSGGSSGSSGSSTNNNQLSKKQLKEISNCISDANKGPNGLSSKMVRDCYDQTVGLPTTNTGSTLAGLSNTNSSGTK